MHLPTTASHRYRYAGYRQRLALAVTLSVLVHAFILSLRFGLPGLGLPGLELPWSQRRAQPGGLNVVLSNTRRTADVAIDASGPPAASEPTIGDRLPASEPTVPPQVVALPTRSGLQLAPSSAPAKRRTAAKSKTRAGSEHLRAAKRRSHAAAGPRLITQDDMGQNSFAVPLPVLDQAERTAASDPGTLPELAQTAMPEEQVQSDSEERFGLERDQMRAAQALAEEEAERHAREVEARVREEQRAAQESDARRQAEALAQQARQKREEEENARRALELEAQRLEQQRQQDEARRQAEEAAQQEAALALQKQAERKQREEEEKARLARELDAKRREELRLQEEIRIQALEREARRQEQEAALRRQQAEELAARERAEADARRQAEAVQARQREQTSAGKDWAGTAHNTAGGSLASRALELARKVDDAPGSVPSPPVPAQAVDPARRRSILGRVDQDVGLMMYVESWRLKIERNGRLNYKQSLAEGAYTEPIVTVAVRSDGSIEDVVFHRSSGRPELDEAVRRIVRLNARYAAFPPELARRFDVIEIRRMWNFDDKLRLLEEVR